MQCCKLLLVQKLMGLASQNVDTGVMFHTQQYTHTDQTHTQYTSHTQFKWFVNKTVNGFLAVASVFVSCFSALGLKQCKKP